MRYMFNKYFLWVNSPTRNLVQQWEQNRKREKFLEKNKKRVAAFFANMQLTWDLEDKYNL